MTAKRLFDLVLSSAGLIILTPFMLVIAIAIRLDSPGPVFFRQVRMGYGCHPFRIHKFRTMRAERHGNAPQITIGHDPRITRVGRFLRRSKIDELPQLIDVFRGRMSIVGPRPEVPRYVAHYPEALKALIFSVRPGITDEASLHFINETEVLAAQPNPEDYYVSTIIPAKNRYHLDYVQNQTLIRDIEILLKTAWKIASA